MKIWNPLTLFSKPAAPDAAAAPTSAPAGKGGQQALVPMTTLPAMPTVMTPKVPNKQQTLPGYLPSTQFIAAPLQRRDIRAANTDIASTARLNASTPAVIRALARLDPDLSASVSAYLRVGIPEKYKAVARNMDGTFNRAATQIAMGILAQIDLMPDYASGFSSVASLRSLSESLAKELIIEGSCAMELVLDKNRMPYKFQPIPSSQIVFREDKNTQALFMQQLISGTYIDLDIPTAFYVALDQDLLNVYSASPLEAAVQPVLASSSFLNDMRRICQRHIFQRYDIIIDEEKLRARIPLDILNDTDKCNAYLNEVIDSVQTVINQAGVEEAMVHFDFFSIKYIEGSSGDNAGDFKIVKDIYDAKISTGAKTLPSILGHGAGSQNVASTETMVFLLSANGMVRLKLQEILSKAMTLAVRLFGQDVTVDFQYDSIDLRPDSELEAFRAMKQARTLELCSLGFLTDDETSLELTGQLTPVGFKPLSGTGFAAPSAVNGAQNPAGDPAGAPDNSGPTNKPEVKPNPLGNKQGALQQANKPATPTKPKS